MESDCRWIRTARMRKKDIVEELIFRAELSEGVKVTEITSIQNQFKHDSSWHSNVWYNYTKEREEV